MSKPLHLPAWFRHVIARRLARPAPLPATPRHRRACIYKLDRIGDFVLATGALRTLFRHLGPENCRLIVSEDAAPLAGAEFPTVPFWSLPAHTTGVWRELRPLRARHADEWAGERFDSLICLRHAQGLHRDVTLSWLHAAEWHGLGARPAPNRLALANRPEPASGWPVAAEPPWCRELAAHRVVLTRVLGRKPEWRELRPQLQHVAPAPGDEIVLCPFGNERVRDYPVSGWLAAWRAAFPAGTGVRVLGPATRSAELHALAGSLSAVGASAVAEAGALPLEFVQRIARARCVLTVESAAAHLATALDRPAVVLTGGGHFGWFAPWGEGRRQRWVHHPLDCFGCSWVCRRPRVECLEELPPAAVAVAITEVLSRE